MNNVLIQTDETAVSKLGDGICDFITEYMTEECGYEFGDCVDCQPEDPEKLGDGNCDGGAYNTQACGYDNGDCS